ncbi:MAG: LAGLIDADG family homing endonuclease [Candidatus Daviesbacteria bacterium]|nr:LAGLIDADG family homing endonuclease [Candidatus Daviesbacteria bacterium]
MTKRAEKQLTREQAWEIGKNISPVPNDLKNPELSETALYISKTRYAKRDISGNPDETAKSMFWRVAYNIACADLQFDADKKHLDETAKTFYLAMASQKFIPNTPTLLNAGKPMQQLSACFVLPIEDDMKSIGKTLVDMIMIHKSGGGCISADARVWSTFCGIEPIEVLFSRATADGRKGIPQGLGIAYDIKDLNIETVSMDPKNGKTGLKKVSHVWQYNVPMEDQLMVTTVEGTLVQTSRWHPFMVIKGTKIIKVRADDLVSGDIVLGPDKADEYWPWKEQRSVRDIKIDSDFAWLIGFTLGDGSFGYVPSLRQYRVRWFSGTKDVLEKVQNVLAKLNIKVSIQKDHRGLLSVATLNQKFVHSLLEACGLEKFGPKDSLIRVPEIISKSPLQIIKAFLAGLLDSDGYVAGDGSPSYCSVSQAMIEDLAAMVSLLGYHSSTKTKNPYGKGKLPTYIIQICPLPQVNQLAVDLTPYMANDLRKGRLQSSSRRQTALPLDFRLWRDTLVRFGLSIVRGTKSKGRGICADQLSVWASHNRVNRDDIDFIAKRLYKKNKALSVLLERIAKTGQEIKTITKAPVAKTYYDLSVDKWNTYAAGQSGLLMIHNTGFSFSSLRPYGDTIASSGGTTVGPTSFLQAYNDVTSQIKQGGVRRGANMGILHITHPDILRFAVMKVDEFSLTNFNISVSVTEDWMKQVQLDSKYVVEEPQWDEIIEEIKTAEAIRDVDLKLKKVEDGVKKLYELVKSTHDDEGYELINPRTGKVTDKLNAKKVFLLITQLAWHYGDPGMIIIDRINNSKANPTPSLGMIESTNPCVTGDTLVATEDGWKRVDKIKIGVRISTVLGSGLVNKIEFHKNCSVFRVKFSDGAEVKVTAAHQFHAIVREERIKNSANKKFTPLRLDQLKVGDMVRVAPAFMPDKPVLDLPNGWSEKEYGFFLGVLLGDGCITQTSIERNVVKIAVNTEEKEWTEIIRNILKKAGSRFVSLDTSGGLSANLTVQNSNGAVLLVKQSYLKPAYSYEKYIPEEYYQTNREFLTGLLDGLFSTDGNVNLTSTHPSLRLKTTSKQLALGIRRILLYFGIHGRIVTIKKVADSHIGKRIIISKHQQYEVIISGASMKIFVQQISLSHPNKQKKTHDAQLKFALTGNTWLTQIVSIEPVGVEKVYDLYEPVSDTWNTEGVISRGCGEQPLLPYDACTLGGINVGKHVKNGAIDWETLGETIKLAVHFLDNILDMNNYPIQAVNDMTRQIRRIGLGMMGFADLLVQLEIGYNTDEALKMAEEIMGFINEKARLASIELAKVRGTFLAWNGSIYDPKSQYFKGENLKVRNGAITTIAPTGTTSMLADASSGIEPYFGISYAKNTIEGKRLFNTNSFFLKIAQDEGFYSEELLAKIEENHGSVQGIDEVPLKWQKVFVVSHDISPLWHVKIQAAFQKHVDNAISKTINFSHDATVEDVRKVYMMVYELGCKGVTIYRDGSREKQILETKKDSSYYDQLTAGTVVKSNGIAVEAQDTLGERPMILRGRTYKINTPVGEAFVTINRDNKDQLFEVFVTIGRAGMHTSADAEAIGRLASLALRRISRTDANSIARKIVGQLKGIGGSSQIGFGKERVMSLADAIAKALSEELSLLESTGTEKSQAEVIPLGLTTEETNGVQENLVTSVEKVVADFCPECGQATFVFTEGCKKCHSCGYSMC